MGLDLLFNDGQTPLDENEIEGLLIPTITTREELDEFEQQNIEQALQWILKKTLFQTRIGSERGIYQKASPTNVWRSLELGWTV